MKKTNAAILALALVILTGVSWYMVVAKQVKDTNKYYNTLNQAQIMVKKGIFTDALGLLTDLEKLFGESYDLELQIADTYKQMGDEDGFLEYCDKAIAVDQKQEAAYVRKAQFYMDNQKFSSAIQVVNAGLSNIKDSESLLSLNQQLQYKYRRIEKNFNEIKGWHTQIDCPYVVARRTDDWGLYTGTGDAYAQGQYDDLGAYDDSLGVLACCKEGFYFYIDSSGNRKLVPDKSYEYLGAFGNGYAPAQADGVCGYIDKDFKEYAFEYEYTGAFANGVAAVKKNGKWALIDTSFKPVTEFVYEDILQNEYGFCSSYSLIWAKKDGKYILLGTDGKQIGNASYEDVKAPASEGGMIAVKKGDKWGYITSAGEMAVEAKYEDADSYACGLAPVKQGEFWQYMDEAGKIVIEEQFYNAKPFSDSGVTIVYNGSYWYMIVLSRYDQ